MSGAEFLDRLSKFAEQGLDFLAEPRERHSYRELAETIAFFCGWLDRKKLGPGDRIALVSTEPFATAVCVFACLIEGITIVMLPAGNRGGSVLHRMAAAGCKAALIDGPEGAQLVASDAGPLARLLRKPSLDSFSAALRSAKARKPLPTSTAAASAIVVFSSGSTGIPKGVRWSHRAVSTHLETYRKALRYEPGKALINGLPLEHTDGFFHGPLTCGWVGMKWVRPPRFSFPSLDVWADLISREAADILVAVPSMLEMVLRLSPSGLDEQLARLDLIVSSAECLRPSLWQTLQESYAPVANIYGMSETVNGGLFALPWERNGYETVGRPIDMQAIIRDEAGIEVAAGCPGVLHVKGDNLFEGYEAGTAFERAPLVDGWFSTADLAVQRQDGTFEIKGRVDEARNIGGILVHPAEIDAAAYRLAYVKASKTLMLETEGAINGIAPVCFVASDDAQIIERIQADLTLTLPPALRPRRIVAVSVLPVTDNGKVDRDALQRLYRERVQGDALVESSSEVEHQIVAIAAGVLNVPVASISMSSTQDNVFGWDSFGHINLALGIERHFGFRLSYGEVTSATSLADFAAIARQKLVGRSGGPNKT